MTEPIRKSKKPANTGFKQQRLKSWQPILTPKAVLPTLFIMGAIFAPLGGLLLSLGDQVSEISIDYTDCASVGNEFTNIPAQNFVSSIPSGDATLSQPTYKSEETVIPDNPNKLKVPKCTIRFEVHGEIKAPIYLYYQLTNFYQNHRKYVKSLSYPQLRGDSIDFSRKADLDAIEASCYPLAFADEQRTKMYYPCGLIANSVFNDTFTNITTQGSTQSAYSFSERDITWPGDSMFYGDGDYPLENIVPPPYWVDNYPNGTYTKDYPPPRLSEDKHLQVWFRVAGLPRFRKLYAKNMVDNMEKGKYEIEIYMKYNIQKFGGRKSLVISTVGPFGGKNPSLGFAYIAMGAICVIAGIIFTARHIYKPRKLGDHTYLSWNQGGSERAH